MAPVTHLSSGRLAGKNAVITGGAGGMGRAASILFAREGARVTILDIQTDPGHATVDEIESTGGTAQFLATDVTDVIQVERGFAVAGTAHGETDIVFSHAGTIIVKPLHETDETDYDRLMAINAKSSFLVCREAVRRFLAAGKSGSIVITSSIGGEKGFALESVYCMSKGAVLQLARSISTEYRHQGIRCNAVCPGFVDTAHGQREIRELDGLGQTWEAAALGESQVRLCEPSEVAAAALYLASDDSSFINGAALYVDNGWYAKG
jgi:NAD(P)-dependent dehydrogenase (short-subunit alcohol dehydrogenase family)